MEQEIIEENGIKLVSREFKKQSEKLQFYNLKLSNIRQVVLATLRIETVGVIKPLICLDGVAKSGVAGLQWKKHLGSSVHVVLADKDVDTLKQSCDLNCIQHSDWLMDPGHVTGQWPITEQGDEQVHVCPFPAQTILHLEAYNFVFIHTNQSTTMYTDPVMSNIRNNGVACFFSGNIVSQCFRSPQFILRQYGAHVQKTEYVVELALRVLISDIARSASRYQRGIEVLYSLCAEKQFLVVVRVTKTNQSAVDTADSCGRVLHCLMCEERAVWPRMNTPVEQPYSLLSCDCKSRTPGKTAIILGPMWLGNLISVEYVKVLIEKCTEMKLNDKMITLLDTILSEGICERNVTMATDTVNMDAGGKRVNMAGENVKGNGENQEMFESANSTISEPCNTSEPPVKRRKVNEKSSGENATNCADEHKTVSENEKSNMDGDSEKGRQLNHEEFHESKTRINPETRIINKAQRVIPLPMPLFYYDIQKKKYSGYPKLPKFVNLMRQEGFRASRTHFDDNGVRTDATIKDMDTVISKYKQSLKTSDENKTP